MSVNKPKLKDTSSRIEPAQAVEARNESRLAPFTRHKSVLLSYLRNAREHVIGRQPFDAERSWLELTKFALLHVRFEESRNQFASQNPEKLLAKLATTLSIARSLTILAIQDGALLRAWRDSANMTTDLAASFTQSGSTYIIDELEKALRTLEKLKSAAGRAASDARRKNGRPKGPSKLPRLDVIIGMAVVYRRSTGRKPAAGDGQFARFASKCLTALGHSNFKYNSLVDAIKRARHEAHRLAAINKPSPFA